LFGKVGGHVKPLFIFPSAPHTSSMDILIIHEKSSITTTISKDITKNLSYVLEYTNKIGN